MKPYTHTIPSSTPRMAYSFSEKRDSCALSYDKWTPVPKRASGAKVRQLDLQPASATRARASIKSTLHYETSDFPYITEHMPLLHPFLSRFSRTDRVTMIFNGAANYGRVAGCRIALTPQLSRRLITLLFSASARGGDFSVYIMKIKGEGARSAFGGFWKTLERKVAGLQIIPRARCTGRACVFQCGGWG